MRAGRRASSIVHHACYKDNRHSCRLAYNGTLPQAFKCEAMQTSLFSQYTVMFRLTANPCLASQHGALVLMRTLPWFWP